MADLIERQAAIDALRAMQTYKMFAGDDSLLIDQAGAQTELMMLPPAQPEEIALHESCTNCPLYDKDRHKCPRFNKVIPEALRELQPAQPDIIHCKDCRHHWTYKCMDGMPLEGCDLNQTFYDANIDYCSLAERREVTE